MYKFLILTIAGIFLFASAAHAEQVINFTNYAPWGETLQGVDGDTSSWSSNNGTVNLWQRSWDLLDGEATVTGYIGSHPWFLSHRGTRGLGVWNFIFRENDEIDSKWGHFFPERIEITFNNIPYWLNSLEIRSLFDEPNLWTPGTEEGHVDFYLSGDKVGEQHLVGWEDISTPGTNGVNSFTYATPLAVDKLVFYVPTGQSYTRESEFAVARLGVTATPEPISTILFLTGGAVMGIRIYRKRKKA